MNGKSIPWWEALYVEKGSVLSLGAVEGPGCRAYMAVAGGFDVPDYLGSKSTFSKGGLGGYEGRPLTKGDVIPLNSIALESSRMGKLDSRNGLGGGMDPWASRGAGFLYRGR